jgi:hypothetical protein
MPLSKTNIVNYVWVARALFYRNFNSINDVIDAIADEMSEELIEDICPSYIVLWLQQKPDKSGL